MCVLHRPTDSSPGSSSSVPPTAPSDASRIPVRWLQPLGESTGTNTVTYKVCYVNTAMGPGWMSYRVVRKGGMSYTSYRAVIKGGMSYRKVLKHSNKVG